jgi:hypothetical protein
MRSAIALSVAALAGSALAHPSYSQYQHKEVKNVHVIVETVVHTVYEPVKPTSTSIYVAPPAPTSEAPKPTTTAVYTPAPEPTSEAPTTTAAAPSASAAPPSGGDTYIGIVSEWRAKLGLKELASSAELKKNALNCVTASAGVMTHKLNPGTYGQVLAPGKHTMESFLSVFIGGWLCEIPTLPGLDGVCSTMSEGCKILTSDNYSKIGCAWFDSIWGCDLA